MSLFKELKRRNVVRVAVAYLVIGWLLMQVADTLIPVLGLPESSAKFLFLIIAIGFIPALLFSWAFELTPEGVKREKDIERDDSITHVTAKKLDYITLFAIVGIIGFIVVDRYYLPKSSGPASDAVIAEKINSKDAASNKPVIDTSAEESAVVSDKSIAVLPFVNMSSDKEQEYFSDGLTESLLHLLAQVDELRVAARTSSFYFKGKNEDMVSIGKKLRVAHLLEGSVRSSGDKIRITAQLIKVDNGFHLWSGTYDRNKDDIFAIQDEISHAVVEALKVKLLDQDSEIDTIGGTSSSLAYDEYIKGRQALNIYSYESLPQAIKHFEAAIKEDPNYLLAYQGLGETYSKMGQTGLMSWKAVGNESEPLANKMLEIDERSGAAFALQGVTTWSRNFDDPLLAQNFFEKGFELSPNNPFVGDWLARFYNVIGKRDQSQIIYETLLAKDPLSADLHYSLSLIYNNKDMNDKALFHAMQSLNLDPDNPNAAQPLEAIYKKTLDVDKANELLYKAEKIDTKDHEIPATIAFSYLSVLLPEKALVEIEKAEKLSPRGQMTLAAKAAYYQQIGEYEKALRIANKLIDENESSRGSNVTPTVGLIIEHYANKNNRPELLLERLLPWAQADISTVDIETNGQYLLKLRYIELIKSQYGEEHALAVIKNSQVYKLKADNLDQYGISMAMATKDKEALLSGLEKQLETRIIGFWWLGLRGAEYDFIRQEERFKAIEAKIMKKVKQQQEAITGKSL